MDSGLAGRVMVADQWRMYITSRYADQAVVVPVDTFPSAVEVLLRHSILGRGTLRLTRPTRPLSNERLLVTAASTCLSQLLRHRLWVDLHAWPGRTGRNRNGICAESE
jgi:hypothetical protein